MIQTWNFIYIETRTGLYQDDFDRNNPGRRKITEDNVEVINGHLIVREK